LTSCPFFTPSDVLLQLRAYVDALESELSTLRARVGGGSTQAVDNTEAATTREEKVMATAEGEISAAGAVASSEVLLVTTTPDTKGNGELVERVGGGIHAPTFNTAHHDADTLAGAAAEAVGLGLFDRIKALLAERDLTVSALEEKIEERDAALTEVCCADGFVHLSSQAALRMDSSILSSTTLGGRARLLTYEPAPSWPTLWTRPPTSRLHASGLHG